MAVESDLRQRVVTLLREHGFMVQAIETGGIGDGVPDLWYAKGGKSGWLELKKVKDMPKRAETQVFRSLNHPLLIFQENWIGMARSKGVAADILVAYGRSYFFVPGRWAHMFNSFTEGDLRMYQVNKEDIPGLLLDSCVRTAGAA